MSQGVVLRKRFLNVGTVGQVLVADPASPLKMKWLTMGGALRGYGTIAQRNALTGLIAGDTFVTSDMGLRDVHWRWDGTFWRPVNGRAEIGAKVQQVFAAPGNATAFLVASYPIPAGAITADMLIAYALGAGKSGTADTLEVSIRAGSAGLYTDPVLLTCSPATTNDFAATSGLIGRVSDTTLKRLGAGGVGGGDPFGNTGTTTELAAITVANMTSAANLLTIWAKWTTGTAESCTIDHALALIG